MKRIFFLAALMAPMALSDFAAAQGGTKPVESGAVIRGLTLPLPVGVPGTKAAATCNFSDEAVDQAGRMTGASVNCGPGGTTQQNLAGLPARFNAYCVTNAPLKGVARLIPAPIPEDARHCDLSGITPKDATGQFGGAIWR
jgi:hypothetical protein